MNFKRFFAFIFLAMTGCALAAAAAVQPPNIVVIVGDDLGYADIGVHGCKDIPTPHIDSIAKNGVRCSNGYVTCPVCSPTRAALLTGRYQQRFGHEFNPGPPQQASSEFGLPLGETTLANRLKEAGYATGMVGKWHLGLAPKFHPMERGFDEYFGFLHGAHSYVDANADPHNPILRGTNRVDEKEYLTDAFTREAIAYIQRQKGKRFLLYLTYNAVHAPMQAPERYLQRFESITDNKRRTYAAMLSAMDDGIGKVLKTLRDLDLEKSTLVFFVSDNGGPTRANASSNSPLGGVKGEVREGGIRVPFLVQWKGRLTGGKVYEQPVMAPDIFATALAAAGVKLPQGKQMEGVNLLPYLSGEKSGAPHEALFWRFGAQAALRKGNWKWIKEGDNSPRLYNLADDVGENRDFIADKPDLAAELEKQWRSWSSTMAEPLWKTARQRQRARENQNL